MDVKFNCPRCDQKLSVDEKQAGATVECPTCKYQVKVPAIPTAKQPASAERSPTASQPISRAMKYRVYYPKEPSLAFVLIEAPDHRAAARQFFAQHRVVADWQITVEAEGAGDYRIEQFRTTDFMDDATRASIPPPPPVPTLAVVFRILAACEFIGGLIWCVELWPGQSSPGYEWKSAAYVTPVVFLTAGIIFGCLFLAIAEGLIYLHHIRDSLAQKS
jgi:DNA-directed RNA polymerase subunit RPC12/RpoP